jgi:hypothetical protein
LRVRREAKNRARRALFAVGAFGVFLGLGWLGWRSTPSDADSAAPSDREAAYVGNDDAPTCREYVVRKVANTCLNLVKGQISLSGDQDWGPSPRGRCDLEGYASGLSGSAVTYVDTDAVAIAHNAGEDVDWSGVSASCEAGAEEEVEKLCQSLGDSAGC